MVEWILQVIAIVVPVAIDEMSSPSFSVPIVPFRGLPTLESSRIVLNGNQRLYRADARIGNMAPAPVLNDAIRMFLCLLFAPVSVLPPGRQTRERKYAERTNRQTYSRNNSSHEASPIDSGQCLANGHPASGNVIKRLAKL
jgi:hypothetical protein